MKKKSGLPTKRIAAITMARNDEFFLTRWIEYYGAQFGPENLYIYLDGTDQKIPENAGWAHIEKLPHTDLSRAAGDKYRIGLMNDLARKLLETYDIVIGCDCDEFLIVDPKTNKTLAKYLSEIQIKNTVSGLGLDVGQNMKTESVLDTKKPILHQREYALLSTRYTKPVVKTTPLDWGSGFHSISGHNFHIDKNLYLLHFGAVDMQMLLDKAKSRGPDWLNHLHRRGNGTINAVSTLPAHGEEWLTRARILQTFARPIYALDKPGMFGIKRVVKIPDRFKKSHI
ncbi:MAG: glycosyltransferase family 2 protein [Proteobacteria bacterium]|uniref:Glycosyltransferase family 2 protein n=1 Tax=Candidatus Enterousia avistercoris TaxID=2840788 RepID=A0A9D9DCJ7_9PROT|nr:glycosyltransferase family 2 protein [Candidatus Enterousia avistercoris]